MSHIVLPPEQRRGNQFGPPHPSHCINETCKVPLISKGRWAAGTRPEGFKPHGSKGLCQACYERRRRHGTTSYIGGSHSRPSPNKGRPWGEFSRSREEVLEEYLLVRNDVRNVRQAAERMGMTFAALDRALYRARKAGDERGNVPLSQIDEAIRRGLRPSIVSREDVAA